MVKGIKKKRIRIRRELKKTVVANRRRNKDEERNEVVEIRKCIVEVEEERE